MIYKILAVVLLFTPSVFAKIDLQDRLKTQQAMLDSHSAVFGESEYARVDEFKKLISKFKGTQKKKFDDSLMAMQGDVPAKVLMPLVYWKWIKFDKDKLKNETLRKESLRNVVRYSILYRLNSLRDVIDHPLSGTNRKFNAEKKLKELLKTDNVRTDSIYLYSKKVIESSASDVINAKTIKQFVSAVMSNPLLSGKPLEGADYSLSSLGFIPGNKVQLIHENRRDSERMDWVNNNVIFNNFDKGIEWEKPHFIMPMGPADVGNPMFKDPIFAQIRDMIKGAKESIFIDIFLFGGTMGATLSKYLVDRTIEEHKKNKNFKTLLLHDFATNYNMKNEIMPVFNYIRNRINNDPYLIKCKCMVLLQANIYRHPPGIPFGITNLINPNKDVNICKAMQERNTYYESKIDHSKVIVVDANSDLPKAYFGSKNWSDHSGAYYYDDALYVEGPAAALAQASYADDVKAALTTDPYEKACMYFREEGFSNDHYISRTEELVDFMSIKRNYYPTVGNATVRLAEANVDGRIKNTRNQLVEMIANAKKYIYMEQLFIYDKYINDALIKKKKQNPNIVIRILADNNDNFGMNGFPNTMFLQEFEAAGIEVKAWHLLPATAKFPDGTTQDYHQENHRKITSVDGEVLMVGSSNMNPDTFQGSFREFGMQVFDPGAIQEFEERFKASWGSDMTFKYKVKNLKLGERELSEEYTELFNSLARQLIRIKDDLEKRH